MMFGCRKEEAVSNDLSLVKKLSKALSPAFGRMRTLLRKISGFFPELLCRMRYRSSLYRSSCRIAKYSDLKKDRGAYGEFLVYDALRREKGRWLFNLYLPKGEEKTEIDALLLSERGIFLLESKNFSGRVYGSVGNPEWFHTFVRGGYPWRCAFTFLCELLRKSGQEGERLNVWQESDIPEDFSGRIM